VRKSVWDAGQWWVTASLVSSVRFQGWLRRQNSRVGVASLGGPYLASSWRGDVLLRARPAGDDLFDVGRLDLKLGLALGLVLALECVADALGDHAQGGLQALTGRKLLRLWLLVAGHVPHFPPGTHTGLD
jgi:hypothetical protein